MGNENGDLVQALPELLGDELAAQQLLDVDVDALWDRIRELADEVPFVRILLVAPGGTLSNFRLPGFGRQFIVVVLHSELA